MSPWSNRPESDSTVTGSSTIDAFSKHSWSAASFSLDDVGIYRLRAGVQCRTPGRVILIYRRLSQRGVSIIPLRCFFAGMSLSAVNAKFIVDES